VHLVSFTIEIYYDARPYERQMKHQVTQYPNTQHAECALSTTSLTCDKYIECENSASRMQMLEFKFSNDII